jgi:hypothetical protein
MMRPDERSRFPQSSQRARPLQTRSTRCLSHITAGQGDTNEESVSGFEPLTLRLQEGLSPTGPREASISSALRCLHKGRSGMVEPVNSDV